jgi:small subunit ribosomal protein S19
MANQEFRYKGKSTDELKNMSIEEFSKIVPSRQRRSLNRTLGPEMKKILTAVEKGKKEVKTHGRDVIIVPQMIGLKILVHNGKTFVPVTIVTEMLGHYLGEFSLTRNRVAHNAPGIGSTRSSASVSVR